MTSKYGWLYSEETHQVWNPKDNSIGPQLIEEDGRIEEEIIQSTIEDIQKKESFLWDRLGPIRIDGIEIGRHTKIWDDEIRNWLKAKKIRVIEQPPEPQITFYVENEDPSTQVIYSGSELLNLREKDLILSEVEVSEQIQDKLGGM